MLVFLIFHSSSLLCTFRIRISLQPLHSIHVQSVAAFLLIYQVQCAMWSSLTKEDWLSSLQRMFRSQSGLLYKNVDGRLGETLRKCWEVDRGMDRILKKVERRMDKVLVFSVRFLLSEYKPPLDFHFRFTLPYRENLK